MSDRNSTPHSSPRDMERYAELSDLLGDLNERAPIGSLDPVIDRTESPSLESSFASVDAAYPIRPREVSISKTGFDANKGGFSGAFSRATPVAAPIAPVALNAWDLRPTLEPKSALQAEPYFEPQTEPFFDSQETEFVPAISMPEPELSDEDAFQSVLEGLEDDILSEVEIANYEASVFEAPLEPQIADFNTYENLQQAPIQAGPAEFSEPVVEVAASFDPSSEFDRAFDEAIFDELPAEYHPVENATPQYAPANYEALRPQASRETIADATDISAISMPHRNGFNDRAEPVYLETASPYSDVPTTGSLYVPEFVAAEESVPQNNSSYDDFEIESYQPIQAPVPVASVAVSPAYVEARETVVQGQTNPADRFDELEELEELRTDNLSDDDFASAFENDFSATDELASIIDPNFNDDPLIQPAKADDFVPMPPLPPIVPKSTGKAKWLISSTLGLALVGVVGYFLFSDTNLGDGQEPAIVRADNEPVRVAPDNPGGTVVPNQDRVVFNEVGSGAAVPEQPQETLIEGRQEPAIDASALKQEERVVAGDVTVEPDALNALAIAPRSVQTVTVRPDGTLVTSPQIDQAAPSPQLEIVPEVRPEAANNALPVFTDAQQGQPATGEGKQTQAPAPTVAEAQNNAQSNTIANKVPARVVELKPVKQKTKSKEPAVPEATALDALPSRPSDQPVNIVNGDAPAVPSQPAEQQIAVVEPVAEAAPVPAAGSYSIQIASTPSEDAANSTLRSLSSKYGTVLGGRDYAIQKAEVPGKGTMFRVRILAGSKEDAAKLCARYKSAGGSCFVTR